MDTPEYEFEFEHAGRKWAASVYRDDDQPKPWERSDGHGVVLYLPRAGDALPKGARRMAPNSAYYYDQNATELVAQRDCWGLCAEDKAKLAKKLGRQLTDADVLAAAVESDYRFLSGWVKNYWHYVGVAVQGLALDGTRLGRTYDCALWGIESNAKDYIKEVAIELADQWLHSADPVEKLRAFTKAEDKKLPVLDLARLVYERVQEAQK